MRLEVSPDGLCEQHGLLTPLRCELAAPLIGQQGGYVWVIYIGDRICVLPGGFRDGIGPPPVYYTPEMWEFTCSSSLPAAGKA